MARWTVLRLKKWDLMAAFVHALAFLRLSVSADITLTGEYRQPDGNRRDEEDRAHQQAALELTELFRLFVVGAHMSATAQPHGIRRNGRIG